MPGLKITLLQQPLVWMDGPANLRHFDRQLEGIIGRDVIVLPEMFTTGFAMEAAKQSLPEADVVEWMHARAAQTQALIAGSAALQTEHGAVNRFLLVEPDGTVHHYDKRHLFRMADEHHHYEAGDRRVVFEWRGWRILPLVCYDLRFPVWSRNLNDYDLALYVANWPAPRSLHWPMSPAVTGSVLTVTAIITAAIAGLSVPRGRLSPLPIRIRPPVLMPNCRWLPSRNIAKNFPPGAMPILLPSVNLPPLSSSFSR